MCNKCLPVFSRYRLSCGTAEVSKQVFLFFAKNLTYKSDSFLGLLRASISVFLFSLSNLKSFGKLEETAIIETFKQCEEALRKWIAHKDVIGGSFFGGYVNKVFKTTIYTSDEMKVQTYTIIHMYIYIYI